MLNIKITKLDDKEFENDKSSIDDAKSDTSFVAP